MKGAVAIKADSKANYNNEHIELSDRVIHQLYQTTRAMTKSLNQLLEAYGLFSSEWTVINSIKLHGEMTQSALADYLNIEPAAISKSLSKLEKKGFIERRTGEDKREKYVFLSQTALRQYPEWSRAIAKHREQTLTALPAEEQKKLALLLDKIRAKV